MSNTEVKNKSNSEPAKDFFDVLFVGLFCFKRDARLAVMPDGTQPDDPTIPPHVPFLVVDPEGVNTDQSSGWDGNDPALTADGIYTFGKCTIDITKATTRGDLDAEQHDEHVFNLVDADKSYRFAGAGAKTIAEIVIGQGTLKLFKRPDANSVARDAGTVSRLRVSHDGDIVVTVAVEGEQNPRILALKPGTDIAIANSLLALDPEKTGDPFALFGRIAKSGTIERREPVRLQRVPAIGGNYQVFRLGRPVGDGSGGGGAGCCPP